MDRSVLCIARKGGVGMAINKEYAYMREGWLGYGWWWNEYGLKGDGWAVGRWVG